MIRARVAAGVAALCVLVAGCSSTVQQTSSRLVSQQEEAAAAAAAASDASGAAGAAAAATQAGGAASAAGARTANTATVKGGGAKATGPIRIGVNYSLALGSIMATFGGVDSTDGDAIDSIRPIIDWINAHGGIAGRKVEAVLHGIDPTEGSFAVQEQRACAAFTEDATVSAVVTGAAAMSTSFTSCLARKGVPVLYEIQSLVDDMTFREHGGYLYQPLGISTERQGFFIDELAAAGYLQNAKVGVLYADTPIMKRYLEQVVRAGLTRHGVTIASEYAFTIPGSAADASSFFSQASNAVLRFRSAGITHVIFVPTGGAIPYAFMPAAESQNYRPRYAMNSFEIPAFVDLQVNNKQLTGALAVGWLPTSDVLTPQRPKDNPAERLCFQITNSRSDIPSRYCEGLFFLKAAWDASGDVSPAGLQRGAKMLRTTWRSPWTFATNFGNGRADGASQYNLVRFDDGCQCFVYDGPLKAIP